MFPFCFRCDVCNILFEMKEALENHAYSTSHLNQRPGQQPQVITPMLTPEKIAREQSGAFCNTCAEGVTDAAGHYASTDHKQRAVFAEAYLGFCTKVGHMPNHLPQQYLIKMLKASTSQNMYIRLYILTPCGLEPTRLCQTNRL